MKPKGWNAVEKHMEGLEDSFDDAVNELIIEILKETKVELMWERETGKLRIVVFFYESGYTATDKVQNVEFDFSKVMKGPHIFDKEEDPHEYHSPERIATLRKIAAKFTKMADAMERHYDSQKL